MTTSHRFQSLLENHAPETDANLQIPRSDDNEEEEEVMMMSEEEMDEENQITSFADSPHKREKTARTHWISHEHDKMSPALRERLTKRVISAKRLSSKRQRESLRISSRTPTAGNEQGGGNIFLFSSLQGV